MGGNHDSKPQKVKIYRFFDYLKLKIYYSFLQFIAFNVYVTSKNLQNMLRRIVQYFIFNIAYIYINF